MKSFKGFTESHGLCCIIYDTDKKLIPTGDHFKLSLENETVCLKWFDSVIQEKENCSVDSPMNVKLERIGNNRKTVEAVTNFFRI